MCVLCVCVCVCVYTADSCVGPSELLSCVKTEGTHRQCQSTQTQQRRHFGKEGAGSRERELERERERGGRKGGREVEGAQDVILSPCSCSQAVQMGQCACGPWLSRDALRHSTSTMRVCGQWRSTRPSAPSTQVGGTGESA